MFCHLQAIACTVLSAEGTDMLHPFVWITLTYASGAISDVISPGKPSLTSPPSPWAPVPSDGIRLMDFSHWSESSLKVVRGTQ